MISVDGKEWQELKTNKNLVEKLEQENNFTKILSQLIISRKFDDEEVLSIDNNINIDNIFCKNLDFILSVDLVIKAIKDKEKICILGDYDVDGSTATSLLARYFADIKHPFFFYIPDRIKDGYGASEELFKRLIKRNPKLIIMVDCGSTSVQAINFLNKNKIKSLIIDHHEINKPYPSADVIINPKKNNGYQIFDYLCATSLTYFFLMNLIKRTGSKINLKKYLIYVVLATVCDVMPLRKLNRLISIKALKEFDINDNLAFKTLYSLTNKKNKISINDLGYLIGPILNAGGRLGKSQYATELLYTNDLKIVNKISIELIKLNEKRRLIESSILNEINFKKIEKENKDIIIYYNPKINEGLIGIIAARLKDHFNRACIVITKSNDLLKGSARSINGYNIGNTIKNLLDKKIIINGGGHNMAAGFTLEQKNLDELKKFMFKDFIKKCDLIQNKFYYDAQVSSIAFNKDFFNDINKIGPFGTNNPNPTFLFKELKIIKTQILSKKHISCILKSKIGFSINSISFNVVDTKIGNYLLNYKKNLNVLGQINENNWNNKNILQLTIRDLIL